MTCLAGHAVSTNSSRKELYVKLWEPHRCTGSGPICRWTLVDTKFLDHFSKQYEKVKQRMGISEDDVFQAVTSLKRAAADAREMPRTTEAEVTNAGKDQNLA